jgi:hypothetical protein
MKLNKAVKRDKKRNKKRHGMRIDGQSVKLIAKIQKDKTEEIKKERDEKQSKEG